LQEKLARMRRRLEHFLRTTNPMNLIKIIDFSRSIANEKEKKLLEIQDDVRKQYKD
jgi:hypothetical protein